MPLQSLSDIRDDGWDECRLQCSTVASGRQWLEETEKRRKEAKKLTGYRHLVDASAPHAFDHARSYALEDSRGDRRVGAEAEAEQYATPVVHYRLFGAILESLQRPVSFRILEFSPPTPFRIKRSLTPSISARDNELHVRAPGSPGEAVSVVRPLRIRALVPPRRGGGSRFSRARSPGPGRSGFAG